MALACGGRQLQLMWPVRLPFLSLLLVSTFGALVQAQPTTPSGRAPRPGSPAVRLADAVDELAALARRAASTQALAEMEAAEEQECNGYCPPPREPTWVGDPLDSADRQPSFLAGLFQRMADSLRAIAAERSGAAAERIGHSADLYAAGAAELNGRSGPLPIALLERISANGLRAIAQLVRKTAEDPAVSVEPELCWVALVVARDEVRWLQDELAEALAEAEDQVDMDEAMAAMEGGESEDGSSAADEVSEMIARTRRPFARLSAALEAGPAAAVARAPAALEALGELHLFVRRARRSIARIRNALAVCGASSAASRGERRR